MGFHPEQSGGPASEQATKAGAGSLFRKRLARQRITRVKGSKRNMWQHQRQSTEKCKTSQQKKRRWLQKMICLTAAVAICSTYAFIPPAHARELQCVLLEHAHSDACYTQVTSKNVPVCSKEKLDVHKHSSACYDASGDLICGYVDSWFIITTTPATTKTARCGVRCSKSRFISTGKVAIGWKRLRIPKM